MHVLSVACCWVDLASKPYIDIIHTSPMRMSLLICAPAAPLRLFGMVIVEGRKGASNTEVDMLRAVLAMCDVRNPDSCCAHAGRSCCLA